MKPEVTEIEIVTEDEEAYIDNASLQNPLPSSKG